MCHKTFQLICLIFPRQDRFSMSASKILWNSLHISDYIYIYTYIYISVRWQQIIIKASFIKCAMGFYFKFLYHNSYGSPIAHLMKLLLIYIYLYIYIGNVNSLRVVFRLFISKSY